MMIIGLTEGLEYWVKRIILELGNPTFHYSNIPIFHLAATDD